jgi:hypothetical protein
MFIYSSRGKWAFPPLLWSFPPTAAFTSIPTPDCWACASPAFSGGLVYLQFCEGFPSPPFGAQGTLPSLLHVFFVVVSYYSVFLFSLGGGGGWSKWRCSAQAGGVEESKFCLFSVVFPVRCVSSVSPRLYFRRHTFCFLPIAAILEFPQSVALNCAFFFMFRSGFFS